MVTTRLYSVLYADCMSWSPPFEATDAFSALNAFMQPDWGQRQSPPTAHKPLQLAIRIVRVDATGDLLEFHFRNGRYENALYPLLGR